jgi:hypothetical protein
VARELLDGIALVAALAPEGLVVPDVLAEGQHFYEEVGRLWLIREGTAVI